MKKWKKRMNLASLYLPLIFWMGLIFAFSSIPGNGYEGEADFWFYFQRKGAHIFEFFILAILSARLAKSYKLADWKAYLFAGVFSLFYALLDEYHQTFVFQREGKLLDVGIDGIGIALGMGVYFLGSKLLNRRKKKNDRNKKSDN